MQCLGPVLSYICVSVGSICYWMNASALAFREKNVTPLEVPDSRYTVVGTPANLHTHVLSQTQLHLVGRLPHALSNLLRLARDC